MSDTPIIKKEAEFSVLLPTHILTDRSLSVLEAITEYLKDEKGLRFYEVAQLLNRNHRTIWTCYHRAKKKRGLK